VSRHMGLFAVARLAERHRVRVRLRPRSPHGLTALVWLPESVTEREASMFAARSRPFAAQAGGFQSRSPSPAAHGAMPTRPVPDTRPVPEVQPASYRRDVVVPEHAGTGPSETVTASTGTASTGTASTGPASTGPASTGPVPVAAAAPAAGSAATSDWFRSRPSTAYAGKGDGSAGPATTPSPSQSTGQPASQPDGRGLTGSDGWSVGRHAAQIVAEPVRGDFTAAGLPTRVPRANLIPGSAGGRSAGAGAPSRPGSGPEGQAPITPRSPRSPDVARNRLSGFQRGVRRAKGLTPDDGEGADR